MADNKKKRILLKLSGEAIAKKDPDDEKKIDEIFDSEAIDEIAGAIKKLVDNDIEVAVVVGGGNIWRGAYGKNLVPARADHMGMLATMINCMRVADSVEKAGCKVTVMSSVAMTGFAEQYDRARASEYLSEGRVVFFGGGLGIPFITTDTAVVVRAAEVGADVILMAKNIDGMYEKNPRLEDGTIDRSVARFKVITYNECLKRGLEATDISASVIAGKQNIDMYIFALSDPENILRAARGDEIGTLVTSRNVETEIYN